MNKTTYKSYIEDINKYPLLTAEQEKELSKKIQCGDMQAKQLLINSNLRFVVQIANTLSKNEDSLMDAIQEGNIGLMHAAAKYDYKFNTRFSTYAHFWITEYISRYRRNSDKSIKIPFKVQETMKMIASAKAILWEKLGKKPTVQEISIYTGMQESEIIELSQYNFTVKSFDAFADVDTAEDFSMLEVLSDGRTNPENEVLYCCEQESFSKIIDSLKDKEQIVLKLRYDEMKTGKKATYSSIGNVLGITVEGTRQIEKRAYTKLQPMFSYYYNQILNERIPVCLHS